MPRYFLQLDHVWGWWQEFLNKVIPINKQYQWINSGHVLACNSICGLIPSNRIWNLASEKQPSPDHCLCLLGWVEITEERQERNLKYWTWTKQKVLHRRQQKHVGLIKRFQVINNPILKSYFISGFKFQVWRWKTFGWQIKEQKIQGPLIYHLF